MPSIEANRAAGEAAKASGRLVAPSTAIPSTPAPPGLRLDPYPASPNSYIRTPLPAISTQQPDQQRNWQSSSVPQDRLIGVPATANPVVSAQTITNIVRVSGTTTGGGVVLETNNQQNALQTLLNLIAGANITLASDAHGGVTITSTASSSSIAQWPLPNTAVTFQARSIVGATSLQTIGDASTGSTSTGSGGLSGIGTAPTANDGVFQQITSGATSNSMFTWFPTNSGIFRAGRNCKYQARSRFPTSSDYTNSQVWCGFSDQNDLRPTIVGANVAAILNDFGTWKGIVYNAGTLFSTTLSSSPTTGTHFFEIDMNDTANTTTFFVDGVSEGVISGHNPSGLDWFPLFSLLNKTAGGTTVNVNFQYMYAQQDF